MSFGAIDSIFILKPSNVRNDGHKKLRKIFDTMNSNTKFFRQLNKLSFQIKKKSWIFQNLLIFSLFFLFLGFVFGNLFGTFLNFFRGFLNWDGLIIGSTILIIEFINYLNYKKQFKKPFQMHPLENNAAFEFRRDSK